MGKDCQRHSEIQCVDKVRTKGAKATTTTTPKTTPRQNTNEIGDILNLFGTSMVLKTCSSSICNDGVQFQMEI